ncbi:retention module-containing protein, partial [Shewanella canadensis]
MGVSVAKQDAVVTNLVGQLKAKDEQGNVRDVTIGDLIKNGEQLIFSPSAQFILEMADGSVVDETSLSPDDPALPPSQEEGLATAPVSADAEIAALQAQILAGEDPTAGLPETAAGTAAGGGGNEGTEFITLDRAADETIAGSGYDTSGFDLTAAPVIDEPIIAEENILPISTSSSITLSEINLPQGSDPLASALSQANTITLASPNGIASVLINGVEVFTGGVFAGPTTITSASGTLTITGYDTATGILSYSYTLNSAVDHSASDIQADIFAVSLTDILGNNTTSTITANLLDDAPNGQDDSGNIGEDDSTISGSVIDNDTQGADSATVSQITNADGANLVVAQATSISGTFGVLQISADGSYSYQLSNQLDAVQSLAQGEKVTDTFTYQLTDSDGDSSIVTLNIIITGSNDAPVITTDDDIDGEDAGSVVEAGNLDDGTPFLGVPSVGGTLAADDIDNGAVLTWSIDSGVGNLGNFSIDPDSGTWLYTLNNALADGLAEGESAQELFNVTVTDEFGGTDTQVVTITVIGTNDSPILTVDSSGSVTEDASDTVLTNSGVLSFSDVDISNTHIISFIYNGDISWSGGTLTPAQEAALSAGFNADTNSWDYSTLNSETQFLGAGESITMSFDVTVTDNDGATDTETVTITINGNNDAPDALADTNVVNEGIDENHADLITGNVISGESHGTVNNIDYEDVADTDTDINNQIFNIVKVTNFDNLTIGDGSGAIGEDVLILGQFGTLTISSDGSYSYQLDDSNPNVDALGNDETAIDVFTYWIDDGNGGQASTTLSITIIGTNDGPTAFSDTNVVTEIAGDLETVAITGNVILGEDHGTVNNIEYGDVVDTDPENQTLTAVVVQGGGTPSVVNEQGDTVVEGLFGTLTISADGSYSYLLDDSNPNVNALGNDDTLYDEFTYWIEDPDGAGSSATLSITILGTNDGPTAFPDTNVVTEGTDDINAAVITGNVIIGADHGTVNNIDYADVSDTDPENQLLTAIEVQGAGNPSDVSEVGDTIVIGQYGTLTISADGNYSYQLDDANEAVNALWIGDTLNDEFTYWIEDSDGAGSSATLTITINGANDSPILDAATNGGVEETDGSVLLSTQGTGYNYSDVDTNETGHTISATNTNVSWNGGVLDGALANTLAGGFDVEVTDQLNDDWNWTYEVDNSLVEFLADGETITLTYNVVLSDSASDSNIQAVTVTIAGTNDEPILDAATNGGVKETDGPVLLSTQGTGYNFSDIDTNDTGHTIDATNTNVSWDGGVLASGLAETLTNGFDVEITDQLNDDWNWSYEVDNSLVEFLADGETITLTYNVVVSDAASDSNIQEVTVTITGTNDVPTISATQSAGFVEALDAAAQVLSDSGTVSFGDIDTTDVVDITFVSDDNITWNNGDSEIIDAGLASALVAGFNTGVLDADAPGDTPWNYDTAGLDLDFL